MRTQILIVASSRVERLYGRRREVATAPARVWSSLFVILCAVLPRRETGRQYPGREAVTRVYIIPTDHDFVPFLSSKGSSGTWMASSDTEKNGAVATTNPISEERRLEAEEAKAKANTFFKGNLPHSAVDVWRR